MSKKVKISVEEKLRIVLEFQNKKISNFQFSKLNNCDFSNIKRWIIKYENNGIEGLKEILNRPTFSHLIKIFLYLSSLILINFTLIFIF